MGYNKAKIITISDTKNNQHRRLVQKKMFTDSLFKLTNNINSKIVVLS